jgi:Secretion system C-terminal sorting domain
MKKSLYRALLLCSCLCTKYALYSQCLPDASTYFTCSDNTAFETCYTFNTICNGWARSHGTPEFMPEAGPTQFVEMVSDNSGSEGIYYNDFPFIAGNNYDVMIWYNFYGSMPGDNAYGSLAVYAASGVTTQSIDACQDGTPTTPARTVMYKQTADDQTFNYTSTADLQTVRLLPSAYNQIWIYPTADAGYQVDLDVYGIKVCPSCTAVVTYSSSTFSPLPVQVNGKDITISEPAQSAATTVTATDAIYLQKGFSASSANNASFVATISLGCSYSDAQYYAVRRNNDSSTMTTIPNTAPGGSADSAFASLRIYPTVSTGIFFISGSPASLANAVVSVFDETGQLRYQLDNTAGNTLQLNLANLSSGLYFVQVRQRSKVTTAKIIINH